MVPICSAVSNCITLPRPTPTRMTAQTAIGLLRHHCGLTQQELAVALGVSVTAIANYEQSRRTPEPQILARLIVLATEREQTALRDALLDHFDAALALPDRWRFRLARK